MVRGCDRRGVLGGRAPVGLSSVAMHWLDRAAEFTTARLPTHKRAFHLGWGDGGVVDWYLENAGRVPPIADAEVRLRPARRSGRVVMRDIWFESPFDMLPEAIRRVQARWLSPIPEADRVVLLHAAWNDEDYRTRMRIAGDLLSRGIGAVIVQHPYYGERRRNGALGTPVPLVSDFCLMGRGGVLEGRVLARFLHRRGLRVGVAGYSMGGNIAGFVGALVDFPVAIAAVAAPYAAGPAFMHGLLRSAIPWEALGGEHPEVVERLSRVLHAGSILNHPPPPHTAAAVLLAGTKDGFVPTAATQAIHHHWPGSKMEWVNAGHASLLWRKRDLIAATIAEALDRLDRLGGSPPDEG